MLQNKPQKITLVIKATIEITIDYPTLDKKVEKPVLEKNDSEPPVGLFDF